jgi:hypothetical protein
VKLVCSFLVAASVSACIMTNIMYGNYFGARLSNFVSSTD